MFVLFLNAVSSIFHEDCIHVSSSAEQLVHWWRQLNSDRLFLSASRPTGRSARIYLFFSQNSPPQFCIAKFVPTSLICPLLIIFWANNVSWLFWVNNACCRLKPNVADASDCISNFRAKWNGAGGHKLQIPSIIPTRFPRKFPFSSKSR